MSQESDNNGLHLVNQKGFYPYNYMSNLEKFRGQLGSKEKFNSLLTDKNINGKEYEHFLHSWNKFEKKTMKDYHDFYLKRDILLVADVFKKLGNNSLKEL